LGVGPGNFPLYSLEYHPGAPRGLVVHNELLETAAESGLAAALLWLAVIVGSLFELRRIRKLTWAQGQTRWAYYYAAMLEAGLVAYIIPAMFVSIPYFELFYVLVALTVALKRIVDREGLPVAAPAPAPLAANHRLVAARDLP
jgi:O-antigen ligase